MTVPSWTAPAAGVLAALILVGWNLAQGVRLSALPSARPALRGLAGLAAFLLLPALVIALVAPTAVGARVLGFFDWLWPATTLGVLLAGALAVWHGRLALGPLVLLGCDALAAWIAVTHWLQGTEVALAPWAAAPAAAASTLMARLFGEAALPWAATLVIPVLVPATPFRRRASRFMLATVTIGWLALAVLILGKSPQVHTSLLSVEQLALPAPPGARGALAVGLRLFGDLSTAPSAAVARRDVALADSLGVTAVHVTVEPRDIAGAALDSIARALESRRDSIVLIVSLRLPSTLPAPGSPAEHARLALIERIARRLRPDVLVPADRIGPPDAPSAVQEVSRHYSRVATMVQRVNRRIVIALGTDAASDADSAAVEWVMQGTAPVTAIALAVRDDGVYPRRFVGALAALARWASLGRPSPTTWLLGVPSAPTVTGERMQRQMVRYALAWATAHPWVAGVIAGDASDVERAVALRTAGGRRRLALADVTAALRLQRDASAGTAVEATLAPTSPNPPDSVVPPSTPSPQ